jgi:hypothetical protein
MNDKKQVNFAGGSPAAGYFLLLRQKKVTQEKATPIRHPFGIPCVARLVRRLRNSHDPLRVHVLKQSSPTSPDQPALLGGAQGKAKRKSKTTEWAESAHSAWLLRYTIPAASRI